MAVSAEAARILVLLAMYRSAPGWLAEQLDSIAAQQQADWALILSDDGPTPDSAAVAAAFAVRHPGRVLDRRAGPGRGFAANFLSLLAAVPGGTARVALADHDDVWFPDKLARADAALAAVDPAVPALYAAGTLVCAADLTPIAAVPPFPRPATFGNALVQSIGGGNTMMLNRAAIDLVRAAVPEAMAGEGIVAHDWWLYQVVTGAGGVVVRDPGPVLAYRQHGGNAVGANRSPRARAARLVGFVTGRFQRWNAVNVAALGRSAHRLTPAARAQLAAFAAARTLPLWRPQARLAALRAAGVYRQSGLDDLALHIACLTGRL